ncbi:protein translocase SEC61 complex subunit gamma [Candidatus Parvarchaeota archaeon]|jgi:protein translocase SEC61 complex gamma subunit|nr:MAG: protein translocase SEC61 complex subunit gamma [Candidatus Parvarchaeota archaeon]HIG52301.1 protein translocase SEC61 complex subunit gamma [Candidatus Pacearchaeota archaeon]
MKLIRKLRSFSVQSSRVWKILRKPSGREFKLISKISALGILVIGLMGFLISAVMKFFN